MIKNVLENIGGIGAYGVISICLFFVVFLGVIIRAARLKRTQLDSLRAIPLNDGTLPDSTDSTPKS